MPATGATPLEELLAAELAQPVPDGVAALAAAVRDRHGAAVCAVLFYGSCLRRKSAEGLVDFYVLVDDYRAVYQRTWLRRANAWLPPNVFQLVLDEGPDALRCKYAVMSLRDFTRAAQPESLLPTVWARFSQPAGLAWVRDRTTRQALVRVRAACVRSMVQRGLTALPEHDGRVRFDAAELWRAAVAATRRAEWRVEPRGRAREIVAADPLRYERASETALEALASDGLLRFERHGAGFTVHADPAALRRTRRRFDRRRLPAKGLYAVQLVKTAFTFGDWVPYALWKIERHTGERVELSPRQRRHPLLFAWPAVAGLLRRRVLR